MSGAEAAPADLPADRFQVRRLARPDLDTLDLLAAYDREAFGQTGLRSFDLNVIAFAGALLVGLVGQEIVACCQLVRTLDDPRCLWVVGFWVRPPWQGRGLGRTLLREAVRLGGQAGEHCLLLTADPNNTAALNLYFSFGFRQVERVSDFYGPGEDRLLLRFEGEAAGEGPA